MTFTQLQNHFQGLSDRAIGKKIGVSPSQMSWYKTNGIPEGRQAIIEVRTNGKLKADTPSRKRDH